jgi:hypothetical protein
VPALSPMFNTVSIIPGMDTAPPERTETSKGTAQIHSIEISDRRLCGSNERVSLTANYRTTFSLAGDPAPRQAAGSHRWELRKQAGLWLVFL